MKFKVGDMVILTQYLNSNNEPILREKLTDKIKRVIDGKIPLEVIRNEDDSDVGYPIRVKYPNGTESNFKVVELDFAVETNWKKRIEGG